MATEVQVEQSSKEEKVYPLDFSPSFLADTTLNDVDYTHTPPFLDDDLITPTHDIDGAIAYVKIPEGLAIGVHLVSCVARTDNDALSPEILLVITVAR